MNFHRFVKIAVLASLFVVPTISAPAQDAKLKQALSITPKQPDVDFDQPSPNELKNCVFDQSKDPPGFVVTDNTNRILRQFFDNNRDGKLDQWSYFKNGIEVYRDVDSNYDRKTDQYRWLGTGGTRWGLDPNQDGIIDSWKIISAEEVASEVFHAIRTHDQSRFEKLLLSAEEFQSLDLGDRIGTEVKNRLIEAQKSFMKFCKTQKEIDQSSEWVHASNGLPAMVAEGTSGIESDVVVYDHASAVFKSRDYGQLALGTIVQTGPGVWRLTERPEIVQDGKPISNGGAFFPMPEFGGPTAMVGAPSPHEEKLAELYQELDELEKQLSATDKPVVIARLEEKKAEMLEQFFSLTKQPERKRDWLENIADSVASSYQSERFPEGLKFLDGFVSRLERANYTEGLDYIRWRSIFAKYGLATDLGGSKDRDKAHEQLIEDLKDFQADFKSSEISADALCQLGIHYEINGEPEKSIDWYREAVRRFPDSNFGKRSAGALVRLEDKGKDKRVSFVGQDINGREFDLQDRRWRDKIVVIHFWETWCTDGLEEIQRLVEKYKDEVEFVGCNIENESEDFKKYMSENRDFFTWTHLHAPGSMERSPLAHQFGVPSEPLILVFDKKGNLVESDIAFGDLEREIERQRRK